MMLDDSENLVIRSRRMFGMESMSIHGREWRRIRERGGLSFCCGRRGNKFAILWRDLGCILKIRSHVGKEGF